MSIDALCKGLVWTVSFRVESSNAFNKDVGLDSNFQCEICIRQEGGIEWPIIVLSDLHEVLTTIEHPFNGLFSRTTWVSRHQKPIWILMKQEIMGWHWH